MFCKSCKQTISTTEILSTNLWRDGKILLFKAQGHRITGRILSFHFHHLSWTWLHTPFCITWVEAVHWNQIYSGEITAFVKHCWSIGLKNTQHFILHHVQKGCECRCLHPFMSTPSTYIHEDRGDNNMNKTCWFCLDWTIKSVYLFMVLLKRPMGCQ